MVVLYLLTPHVARDVWRISGARCIKNASLFVFVGCFEIRQLDQSLFLACHLSLRDRK